MGPTAAASAVAALQMPIARVQRATGTPCSNSTREAGIMTAEPMPCTQRPMSSVGRFGAAPHSADAATKRPTPDMYRGLRPTMSARRPAGASRAARGTA